MITCSRCGKENQDLYKFCLGCGARLQAGAAPAPKPAPVVADNYPPTPPPEPIPHPAPAAKHSAQEPEGFSAIAATITPPGTSPADVSMPAPPPEAEAGPSMDVPITPPPNVIGSPRQPASAPSVQIGLGSVPMQVPSRPASLGVAAASAAVVGARAVTAVPATAVPTAPAAHSPFSPPPADTLACPNCGKQVPAAFAFCGGCGHRMKPTPGAVAEAAIQRTDAVAAAPARVTPRGHLILIRPDGTEGGVFPLQEGENPIGRGKGTLFDADPYLSPKHASFTLTEEGLDVQDQRSLNGIFVRITQEEALESGDSFRIGQELLRFDTINPPTPLEDGTEIIGTPNPGYWGRLSVVVGRDLDGPAFPLFDEVAKLGRERGDILFPEDGYVSGSHCQLSVREGRVYLKDLGSSNGTFLRVRESRNVPSGSLMLMGQQLFRVAYK